MSVYLHLFHGRNSPDEDMDDWGFNGPTIGPLNYVHTTYCNHVKFEFLSDEDAEIFGLDPDFGELNIVEDLIVYEGKYYGDWSVSTERATGFYEIRVNIAGTTGMVRETLHDALALFAAECAKTDLAVQLFDVGSGKPVLIKERPHAT